LEAREGWQGDAAEGHLGWGEGGGVESSSDRDIVRCGGGGGQQGNEGEGLGVGGRATEPTGSKAGDEGWWRGENESGQCEYRWGPLCRGIQKKETLLPHLQGSGDFYEGLVNGPTVYCRR